MLVRHVVINAQTGEESEEWIELPVLTVPEGQALDAIAAQQDTNRATLEAQAEAALTALRNYRDLTSPTTNQAIAQVKTLTTILIGMIRLLRAKYDGTN